MNLNHELTGLMDLMELDRVGSMGIGDVVLTDVSPQDSNA